jgi:hypothetical protein
MHKYKDYIFGKCTSTVELNLMIRILWEVQLKIMNIQKVQTTGFMSSVSPICFTGTKTGTTGQSNTSSKAINVTWCYNDFKKYKSKANPFIILDRAQEGTRRLRQVRQNRANAYTVCHQNGPKRIAVHNYYIGKIWIAVLRWYTVLIQSKIVFCVNSSTQYKYITLRIDMW